MSRALLGIFGLTMLLCGPLFYAGPQLVSDLVVGDKWALTGDLAIKEFKCTRWYFLVSNCNVSYINLHDPGRAGGSLKYLVLGSWSGERTSLLRSVEDQGRVGTTVGLEHMRQRVVSFGVFAMVPVAFMLMMIRAILNAPRRRYAPNSSQASGHVI